METVLSLLPVVYVYWASGLMVWSMIQASLTGNIVRIIKNRHQVTRKTDVLIMVTMMVCAALLYASVFVVPSITALFVDIALVVALWYTVFLGTVSHFNIGSLIHINKTK